MLVGQVSDKRDTNLNEDEDIRMEVSRENTREMLLRMVRIIVRFMP